MKTKTFMIIFLTGFIGLCAFLVWDSGLFKQPENTRPLILLTSDTSLNPSPVESQDNPVGLDFSNLNAVNAESRTITLGELYPEVKRFEQDENKYKFLLGPQFLYAPLKMWWSHLEALYANALAYSVTGNDKFIFYYEKVRKWSFDHFADGEYGEWYGYLSPEGKVIDAGAKGTDIKNSYHIGRAFYLCHRIFAKLASE